MDENLANRIFVSSAFFVPIEVVLSSIFKKILQLSHLE